MLIVGGIPPGRAKLGTSWCPNSGYRDEVDRDDYPDRVEGYRDGSISVKKNQGRRATTGVPRVIRVALGESGLLEEPVSSDQGQRSRCNPEGEYRRAVQLTRRMMGEHAWAQSRVRARSHPVSVYDKGDMTPQWIRRRRLSALCQRACATAQCSPPKLVRSVSGHQYIRWPHPSCARGRTGRTREQERKRV